MSPAEIQRTWGSAWDRFYQETQGAADYVAANWEACRGRVEATVSALTDTRAALAHNEAVIAEMATLGGAAAVPEVQKAQTKWTDLVQRQNAVYGGIYKDARTAPPGEPPPIGAAWFVIAGGLVLTLAAVCFAIGVYEYTMSLRDEARAQQTEIDGRVEAMRENKRLQESTYKPPENPKPPGDDTSTMLIVGGIGVATLVGLAIWATRTPSSRS